MFRSRSYFYVQHYNSARSFWSCVDLCEFFLVCFNSAVISMHKSSELSAVSLKNAQDFILSCIFSEKNQVVVIAFDAGLCDIKRHKRLRLDAISSVIFLWNLHHWKFSGPVAFSNDKREKNFFEGRVVKSEVGERRSRKTAIRFDQWMKFPQPGNPRADILTNK